MNRRTTLDLTVFCSLVGLGIATRMVMFHPNFHAVTAAALLAGVYFRNRAVAACVPLVTMTLSNYLIGGYSREVMIAVYAALVLPIAAREMLSRRLSRGLVSLGSGVAASAVVSSLVFYLVTNAAVWHAGLWYPRSWEGVARCYTAALPFLGYALAGDLLFSLGLFGAYAVALRLTAAPQTTLATTAA